MVVTKHHLTANADYKVDKPFTIVYDTIAHNKTIDKDNEAQVSAFEKLDIFIQDALKQYYNMNGFVNLFDKNNYDIIKYYKFTKPINFFIRILYNDTEGGNNFNESRRSFEIITNQ